MQASPARLGESFGGHQQRLADAVEGIALPAPMSQCLLLHALADPGEVVVGEAHDVERIGHHLGMAKGRGPAVHVRLSQRMAVALMRIDRHHLHAGQPCPIHGGHPSPQISGIPAREHVHQLAPVDVDHSGHEGGPAQVVAGSKRRLVQADGLSRSHSGGIVNQGDAHIEHRRPSRGPRDAVVGGPTAATERPSLPTWAHTSALARSVMDRRGLATSSRRSVQVLVSQSGSGQRQIRLCQPSTAERPLTARSLRRTVRRS